MSNEIIFEEVNFDDPFVITLTDDQKELEAKTMLAEMRAAIIAITPTSEFAFNQIAPIYNRAKEWEKAVEDTRKRLCKPLRDKIAHINDRALVLSDPLEEIIKIAKMKTTQYQAMLDQKKKEEDSKILDAAALFDVADETYISDAKTKVRGDGALACQVTKKRYKLEDISKVPHRYLMVNEQAVKADMKLGITFIPGLSIYEEQETQLRTR